MRGTADVEVAILRLKLAVLGVFPRGCGMSRLLKSQERDACRFPDCWSPQREEGAVPSMSEVGIVRGMLGVMAFPSGGQGRAEQLVFQSCHRLGISLRVGPKLAVRVQRYLNGGVSHYRLDLLG